MSSRSFGMLACRQFNHCHRKCVYGRTEGLNLLSKRLRQGIQSCDIAGTMLVLKQSRQEAVPLSAAVLENITKHLHLATRKGNVQTVCAYLIELFMSDSWRCYLITEQGSGSHYCTLQLNEINSDVHGQREAWKFSRTVFKGCITDTIQSEPVLLLDVCVYKIF
ncbi:hypothetical protein DPMN_145616 [Dreissena polymorpha]|uniref:Uncharacterized protein n=1 Tax=Dreissena polymorpha TaxID=45954 RepID=A0A9D4IYZ9_DREPO|nr:hypothetical protein DPMN_145616 [Dreissena polymorpha]